MTEYAVHLAGMLELTRRPANLPLLLLLRGVVTETVVRPRGEETWGHDALLLRDDVTPERWGAIVKLIRGKFRYHEFPLYEKGQRGWRTIR